MSDRDALTISSIENLDAFFIVDTAAKHETQIDSFRARMREKGISDMQIEQMLNTALLSTNAGRGSFVDNLDALRVTINLDGLWFGGLEPSTPVSDLMVQPASPKEKKHRRAGVTKNKGRGQSKERRKTARYSRRANRHP